MLTKRREAILNFIITEYVTSALPVASHSIAQRREMHVSPATVRNEMAELEEAGYIRRRHISAGGIPSVKGYRYHVESIPMGSLTLETEKESLRRQFFETVHDLETWTRRATEMLAELAQNLAVVTVPKAAQSKIKRLEVVSLQEFLVLLVLVLEEAKIKQRFLPVSRAMTQDELTQLSNKLSAAYGGTTRQGIAEAEADFTPFERLIVGATNEMMLEEDVGLFAEPYVNGLRHLLNQPEFAAGSKMRALLDIMEDRSFLRELLSRLLAGEQFRVVIGEENEAGEMQECSILASRYGSPEGVGGIAAVIGPTRMHYPRSIGSVRFLSSVMSELVADLR